MKKKEFIDILSSHLNKMNVQDIEEIIEEYNAHYDFKLSDGYSEEEISVRLGNPIQIAKQYETSFITRPYPKKGPVISGLIVLDIIVYSLFIFFVAWIIVLFAFSTTSLGIGFSLFTGVNLNNWIPEVPYWCGTVLGVSFVSLAVISYVGTYYSYEYMKQSHIAYMRNHKNILAYTSNKPQLPKLSTNPQFSKIQYRRLRKVFQFSLKAFAISFILGYMVCSLTAKSLEFWHVFEWFQ